MSGLVLVVFVVEVALLPEDFMGRVLNRVRVDAAAADEDDDRKQRQELHFRSLPRKTASARLSMKAV